MPVRPKKGITRRTAGGGLTTPELENLILGFSFFDEPFTNDQERRQCWIKNRLYIMSLQGKAGQNEAMSFGVDKIYFDFGFRPAAWWAYDSPGQRRFVACSNNFCSHFSQCQVAKNISTENPGCVIRKDEQHKGDSFDGLYRLECVSHDFKIFLPQRETEKEFLQRHGLLNEPEKVQL